MPHTSPPPRTPGGGEPVFETVGMDHPASQGSSMTPPHEPAAADHYDPIDPRANTAPGTWKDLIDRFSKRATQDDPALERHKKLLREYQRTALTMFASVAGIIGTAYIGVHYGGIKPPISILIGAGGWSAVQVALPRTRLLLDWWRTWRGGIDVNSAEHDRDSGTGDEQQPTS